MQYVKALENKNSSARGCYVKATLKKLGIQALIQENHIPRIQNIIVDFSPGSEKKCLIISAHYDVVKGSPGANNDASGVSVLLGLCQKLKDTPAPIKIVFFDREEAWLRTPILRLGLLGSLYYAYTANLRMINAVYNLEFCGAGDYLAIWSIGRKETNLEAFKQTASAANRLNLPFKSAHIPWLLISSDHLSFWLRGFPNALTLSLLTSDSISKIEKSLAGLNLFKFIFHRSQILPEPISLIHTKEDTSPHLNESSLKLMLSLLLEVIQEYSVHTEA